MDQEAYEQAKKKVKQKKSFYRGLFTWIIFSIFFIVLNIVSSPNSVWAIYPIAGWGLGVLLQAANVFGFPGMSKDWERKKLEEELQKVQLEEQLKHRYLYLKEKQENNLLNEREASDLETLSEIKKQWDDDELV